MPRNRSRTRAPSGQRAPSRGRRRTRSRNRGRSASRVRSSSRGRSVPRPAMSTSAGEIVLQHTEVLSEIKIEKNASVWGKIGLSPANSANQAGHMKALARIYHRMRFLSVSIEYQGTVGSTVGGFISYGFMYDAMDAPATGWTLANISAMNPNRSGAVWKKSSMVIPLRKMTPQKWLETGDHKEADVGYVVYRADCDKTGAIGFFRVHYKVHFAGPH